MAKHAFLGCVPTKERKNAFVAQIRPRSGQALAIKALLYIALVVICVVLAVALIVKLWNTFIAPTPASQDADLLANIITEQLSNTQPYMQTPMLVRLSGERIVGFDVGQQQVSYSYMDGAKLRVTKEIPRGNCGDDACICTSDGSSATHCRRIKPPKGITSVYLTTNYGYFSGGALVKTDGDAPQWNTVSMPADIRGTSKQFIIDAKLIPAFRAVNSVAGEERMEKAPGNAKQPIIAVLVEKQVWEANGQTYATITVLPDTDEARARAYYLQICSDESKEYAGRNGVDCTGKTFVNSVEQSGSITQACTPIGFSGACSHNTVEQCEYDALVTGPCTCGGKVVFGGVCTRTNQNFPVQCELMNSCADYCAQDGIDECSDFEENTLCTYDPCQIALSGTKCQSRGADGIGLSDRIATFFGKSTCIDVQDDNARIPGNALSPDEQAKRDAIVNRNYLTPPLTPGASP
jgi:hypothetical protein